MIFVAVPPSSKPPTNSLRIDRFLRPFTLKAVQELLGKSGTVTDFWMDHIKTHCYVSVSKISLVLLSLAHVHLSPLLCVCIPLSFNGLVVVSDKCSKSTFSGHFCFKKRKKNTKLAKLWIPNKFSIKRLKYPCIRNKS